MPSRFCEHHQAVWWADRLKGRGAIQGHLESRFSDRLDTALDKSDLVQDTGTHCREAAIDGL